MSEQENVPEILSYQDKRSQYETAGSGNRFHFLAARVVNHWNNLSEATVTQPTIQQFKTQLHKQWDHNNDIYYEYNFSY